MPNGIISAPTSLLPAVADLKKVAAEINTLMEALQREGAKLRSVSNGEVFAAFDEAERLWKQSGFGESNRTTAVATTTDDYFQNMTQNDRQAANNLRM